MANETLPGSPGAVPAEPGDGDRGLTLPVDTLTLRLDIPEILVEAGGNGVENVITLSNPGQEDPFVQYSFVITDLDPAWFKLDTESVLLQRGDTAQVRIKFAVPRRGSQPGIYIYRVQARSTDPPAQGSTTGRVRIAAPPTLQMTLEPATATGRAARYNIHLVNAPTSDLIVDLQGKDAANTLAFTATPPRVRLAPSAEAQATLDVSIRPGVVGEARTYPFTLVANLSGDDEVTLPVMSDGVFVYVPEVTLDMRVEAERVNGPMGDYRIVLTNPTSLNLDVDLAAESPDQALEIFLRTVSVGTSRGLEPEAEAAADSRTLELEPATFHLLLPRQETTTVKALVRILDPDDTATEPRTYPFTIRARLTNIDGPGTAEQTAGGTLRYMPSAMKTIFARLQQTPAPPAVAAPVLPQVGLSLDPAQATGDPARFTVQVENRGANASTLALRAADPAGALDYAFSPATLDLAAGAHDSALLEVRLRPAALRSTGRAPQIYPFDVTCRVPAAGDAVVATAPGAFRQGTLMARLTLAAGRTGPEGYFEIHLTNGYAVPAQVLLRARDAHDDLLYVFTPARLILSPGGAQTVRLVVRPVPQAPPGPGQIYPFEVLCWVPGTELILSVPGELPSLEV
jgi:hypothetical protein